jgi:hypothetical protein
MSAIKEHFHDKIEAGINPSFLSDTEVKILRLKDDIRILNVHLQNEENPGRYSLKKTPLKRLADVVWLRKRITEKQAKLNELQRQLS